MSTTRTAELVYDAKATLGEGALWNARTQELYWVDILEKKFCIYNPADGKNRAFDCGQYVGTCVPRRSGGVVLAVHHGFAHLDLTAGRLHTLATVDLPDKIRFNDGKCDPGGRLWAGTMELKGEPELGALYRLDADRRVHRMLDRVTVSNGIVWSRDRRRMYYIDTTTFGIDAFDYNDADGSIANRRVAATVPKEFGYPDGMAIDAEDMLWVAHFGGYRVTRWNPETGKLLDTIRVPTKNVTACAFGGPKLNQLYITSARVGLEKWELANEPQAGGLFVVEPGTTGSPTFEFAG